MSQASTWALIGTLVKLFLVGLLIVLAAKVLLAVGGVVLAVLGVLFGIALALTICIAVFGVIGLFVFGPFLLVGWVVVKTWKALTRQPEPGW